MNNKPFFSVVLPTLNRAKYISFAIQSVLNQTFEDFELIVSDNSSTDNTEQIVKDFSDKRIRYLKTEKTFPMYDSWEFALDHAKGEYITFLGDDDAQSSIYLESFKEIINKHDARMVCCRIAEYYYKSDSLTTIPFSNKLTAYNSQKAMKDVFVHNGLCKGEPLSAPNLPLLINAVYHNSVFAQIKNKMGRVNPRILSNDFYLLVMTLNFTEQYYYLDSPLSFHGASPESTTRSISNKVKGANLRDTQPELARFSKVPLDIFIPYNFVADALLTAKSHLDNSLNYLDLDLTGYFVNMHRYIHALEFEGNNMSDEYKEFSSVLSKQNSQMQKEINSVILGKKNSVKNNLRRKFHKTVVYRFLRNLRDLVNYNNLLTIEGRKIGFNSITECAKFIDRDFLKKYQSKVN